MAFTVLLASPPAASHAAPDAQSAPAEQAAEAPPPSAALDSPTGLPAASPNAAATPATAPTSARLLPTATPARVLEPAEPFDWTTALFDVAWKLGVVVVLAYGALALLRRSSLAPMLGQSRGQLQVLETVSLGANRGVALLRVGERRVLVGVTPTQITSLAQWDHEAAGLATGPGGPEVPTDSFETALSEARLGTDDRPPPATPPAPPARTSR